MNTDKNHCRFAVCIVQQQIGGEERERERQAGDFCNHRRRRVRKRLERSSHDNNKSLSSSYRMLEIIVPHSVLWSSSAVSGEKERNMRRNP